MSQLDAAIPRDLFALRDAWRDIFLHGGPWRLRFSMLPPAEAEAVIVDARAHADWLFVSAMADVARILKRWRAFLVKAARRRHGIVALDGFNP